MTSKVNDMVKIASLLTIRDIVSGVFTSDLDLDRQVLDLLHRNSLPAQGGNSVQNSGSLKNSSNGSNQKKKLCF